MFQFLFNGCTGFTICSGAYGSVFVLFAHAGEALVVLLSHAADTYVTHVLIGTDIALREILFPEYDIEAHPENACSDENQCCKKNLHASLDNHGPESRFPGHKHPQTGFRTYL